MTVSNGEILRVSARQSGTSGQDIVGVFHYLAQFAVDQADADVVAAILSHLDGAYTLLNSLIAGTYNPVDIKVDVVQIIGGIEKVTRNVGTTLWTGTFNPTGAGGDLPPGATALVKMLTGVGKTYGRKFISGILEGNSVSGFIDAALQTGLVNFAGAVRTAKVISAGNELLSGVYSFKSLSFKRFIEIAVSVGVAYQRRRRLGTGS